MREQVIDDKQETMTWSSLLSIWMLIKDRFPAEDCPEEFMKLKRAWQSYNNSINAINKE